MLANLKRVLICGLQHCTVTLVPHFDKMNALQIAGFLLSDDS